MITLDVLKTYFQANLKSSLADYFTFLRFQSISSEVSHNSEVAACASWVYNYLYSSGFKTEMWPTDGHPVVFASDCSAGPTKPTLLLYCHYDVQPVDPIELWDTPPFEPSLRNGSVYARGAQDNKGQCFYTLLALRALRELSGALPINVKCIIEGEEECGSSHLPALLRQRKEELRADSLAVVDMGLPTAGVPAITLGCRGIVTMEVEVRGSSCDLHSGSHGGIVYNANHALVEILAALHNDKGAIAIPDFYNDVANVSEDIKSSLYLEFDPVDYKNSFGAIASGGEQCYRPLERAGLRPTIEINGLWGGYIGDGFKTVIPAKAHAKISCRLVPDQKPEKTAQMVANFLRSRAPCGIEVDVHIFDGGGSAVRASTDSSVVKAFSVAYSDVFGKPCQYLFEGGSIPIIPQLADACGGAVVLLGMGLPSDHIHAPNEHFSLERLEQGFCLIIRALERLSA